MADEPTLTVVTPEPAAPAAEAPVQSPEQAAAPPPADVSSVAPTDDGSAAAPAPSETPADAPKAAAETATLMEEIGEPAPKAEEAPKVEEAKPAEAVADTPKPEGEKVEGEKPAEAQPEPQQATTLEQIAWAEAYKLPETLSIDDAVRDQLHTALDAFRVDPKANAQQLIDLHVSRMQAYADQVAREQRNVFDQTRAEWRKQAIEDAEFGGQKWEESRVQIADVRNQLVSDAEPGSERYAREWKEWTDMCRYTGAGDHPALFRLLNNIAKRIGEAPPPTGEIRPAPHGRDRKRSLLYDNPTSPNNRQ